MLLLNKIKVGARTCCSCSNKATLKMFIGKEEKYFCSECEEYLLNRLKEINGERVLEENNNKTYSKQIYAKNFDRWTAREDEFLKNTTLTPDEISKKLNRTVSAIRRRLYKLEIKPNKKTNSVGGVLDVRI